jgi:hypothetical protein
VRQGKRARVQARDRTGQGLAVVEEKEEKAEKEEASPLPLMPLQSRVLHPSIVLHPVLARTR